ncbi:MAG: hypothetical protein A2Y25_06120 [Candidatus Melainabacteria bacterium GWF2_37_15]|nr:MAG: hypothetical protein A2Y25_06120 [Candidatus Melainabacteria bacterium GWF2_37_15]
MSVNLLQRTFVSLKHKNYRLFFTGQSISIIGTWIHQTALSWLIYESTGSKFLLGLIAALSSLPMLLFSVFGGVIADRFPKKQVVISTQLISMILAVVLAVIVSLNIYKIWHIVVITMLLGTTFAIDLPVRQAFIIEIAGKQDLMNAIALNSSMVNFARVVGPAIAGIVMFKFGISWCFILNAISFLAVLTALFNIKLLPAPINKRTESITQYTLSGFTYIRQNKLILNLLILMALMGIFGWSYAILVPALAKDIFLKGEQGYAMLVSANGVGALLGALFVAYMGESPHKKTIMNCGIYFFSIMLFLLSLSKIYWLTLILILGAGMGLIVYFSCSTALIQSHIEDSVRGRVMGIWTLIFGGTAPLGCLFVGIISENFGVPAALFLSAIICPVFTFVISRLTQE